jgi:hypothetical protein
MATSPAPWTLELEGMPHFDESMQRIYAWYENEIIDRPPVRFQAHNATMEAAEDEVAALPPEQKKAWWFDVEHRVELFIESIEDRHYHGETFPMFEPNLGPDVYAAFYGSELIYGDVTSWSVPLVKDWDDIEKLQLDMDNEYFRKLEEMTRYALERCKGKYMVGYTDLHPGLDCVAAWRDPQQLCFDMIESPERVKQLAELAMADFHTIYDHFDAMLKAHNQLSICWMGIPSFGKMHVPSDDFSALISPAFYQEFGLPLLQQEVQGMTHNIYHVDGKGVAKHIDAILSVPEVHAIQWVQGVGDDYPIMQWVPFIKDLQARNMPVIVDLDKEDLDDFMQAMDPRGLFVWIATESEDEELEILKRVSKWT